MNYNYSKNKKCICGKLITNNSTMCHACKGKLHSKRMIGKNHPLYGTKRPDITKINLSKGINFPRCLDCNKLLNDYRTLRCSVCSKLGKNNGNFVDGSSGIYPPEFNDELKEVIRKRDNYTCQNCGMIEEEHLIVYGQVLHVHHIDYDKLNCEKDNLITTCKQCNLRANSNREYWLNIFSLKIERIKNDTKIK